MNYNFERLLATCGYEKLSDKVESLYIYYSKNIQDQWLTKEDLIWVIEKLSLDDLHRKALVESYEIIENDEKLKLTLGFLKYAIVIGAHPSNWLIKQPPMIRHTQIKKSIFPLLVILSLIPFSRDDYKKRGIDSTHMDFNLNHLKGYINNHFQNKHEIGIENFGWTTYLASLGLIHIGSLNFMHHVFTDPYTVYYHSEQKKTCVLANAGLSINILGQFLGVNNVNIFDFKTNFDETDDYFIGHRVNPKGLIEIDQTSLSKKHWKLIIKQGDPVIDFHIPTKVPYDIDSIRQSFLEAKSFFSKHYPEYNYLTFWCVSWLYSPQLPYIITKTDSNILAIQKQGYILPATPDQKSLFSFVFHTETPDFSTIQPKTSLEKNIINFIRGGGKVNTGIYLYLLSDLNRFGQSPYIQYKDDSYFESIKPYI